MMNEKGENTYPAGSIPAPGGEVHPRSYIETKVLIKDGKPVEGSEKERDIRDKYQKSPENPSAVGQENKLSLDKERLNRIIKESSAPGALFGRNVRLDELDIKEIGKVIAECQSIVEQAKQNNPEWDQFTKIMEQLRKEGTDLAISKHIINGGSEAKVKLRSYESGGAQLPEVVLPDKTFRLYEWDKITDSVKRYLFPHEDTNTSYLAEGLTKMATLLKSNQKI